MKLRLSLIVLCACMYGIAGIARADGDHATVFECIINGRHVFSDHACGDHAQQRDITVINRMDSVDAKTLKKYSKPVKAVHHHRVHSSQDARRRQCARIRKAKDKLIERMEAGYSAKQDERLHDRLRKLNEQYFELRCSGVR